MKFRKKPVIVDAIQYTGDGLEILSWSAIVTESVKTYPFIRMGEGLFIHTTEGDIKVPEGNYVICGVEGELYSCDPVIFEKTYERVEDEE